jgi:hypothetical protein
MAALNVDKVFRFVQFVANKESRGWVSPEEFNIAAEVSQLTLYSELEGVFAQTKQIEAFLRPFLSSANGLSDNDALPTNFRLFESLYVDAGETYEYEEIDEIDGAELPKRITSSINPPEDKYPILYIRDDKMRVLPAATTFAVTYLRTPITVPTWDYTLLGGRPVYSSGTSVDFEFDEAAFMEISRRVLEQVGINIGKEQVTQYAMAEKMI